jgi:MFS superfamily sulfate permease-like transporter
LHQLPNLLGIDITYRFVDLIRLLHLIDPATLAIGGFTMISVITAWRFFPSLSPPLFGLVSGTFVYYALQAAFPGIISDHVIGDIRIDLSATVFIGLNFLIGLTVRVLTVAVDLILAIIVGILITTANFVVKTGKSVVRRKYRGNRVRSKRVRNLEQTRFMQNHGSKILVIELQGPLFFGSAEEVAREIDAVSHGADYILINMKRVNEIDLTGNRFLLQIYEALKKWKDIADQPCSGGGPVVGHLELRRRHRQNRTKRVFPRTWTAHWNRLRTRSFAVGCARLQIE